MHRTLRRSLAAAAHDLMHDCWVTFLGHHRASAQAEADASSLDRDIAQLEANFHEATLESCDPIEVDEEDYLPFGQITLDGDEYPPYASCDLPHRAPCVVPPGDGEQQQPNPVPVLFSMGVNLFDDGFEGAFGIETGSESG